MRCRVELAPASTPGARRGRRDELRRAQHRLRRHARPVRALAADEAALDERQLGVARRAGGGRRRNARRTTLHRERRPATSTTSPFAFRNALATAAGDLLVDDHGLVHRHDRGQRQLRRDGVDRLRELRAGCLRDRRLDDRRHVLEAGDVLRVGEHRVLRALAERRVGREHVGRQHLAGVERRVRPRCPRAATNVAFVSPYCFV